MTKGRLEAFSDGVLAIIITIMVLELKPPHGDSLNTIFKLWPKFLSYILSFVYIAIYWNNHHHMMQSVQKINGGILWRNMHLLFWLSLIPFVTAWMGENHFTTIPTALYGMVLIMCAITYYFLAHCLASLHGDDSEISKVLRDDKKGKISVILYAVGIGLSFISSVLGFIVYGVVAVLWFIPDKRFEKM